MKNKKILPLYKRNPRLWFGVIGFLGSISVNLLVCLFFQGGMSFDSFFIISITLTTLLSALSGVKLSRLTANYQIIKLITAAEIISLIVTMTTFPLSFLIDTNLTHLDTFKISSIMILAYFGVMGWVMVNFILLPFFLLLAIILKYYFKKNP